MRSTTKWAIVLIVAVVMDRAWSDEGVAEFGEGCPPLATADQGWVDSLGNPCATMLHKPARGAAQDLGEGGLVGELPVALEEFGQPANTDNEASVSSKRSPPHKSTATKAERMAEHAGFDNVQAAKKAAPKMKAHKVHPPRHDRIEATTQIENPGEGGPGDDAGPAEEENDLGESTSTDSHATSVTELGPRQPRAATTCGGHGKYVMRTAAQGLMDVACKCDVGWQGPDCKHKCPMGRSRDGLSQECSGNGACRFQLQPMGTSCACRNNWRGKICQQCGLERQCSNGATIDRDCKACQCKNAWSGKHCSTCSLKCVNGGSPDDDCSKCRCKLHWTGKDCKQCGLLKKCNHGVSRKDCSGCDCKGNWAGPTCSKCGLACKNGVPNHSCTACVCTNQWAGRRCDLCTLKKMCRNEAQPSKACDSCVCPRKSSWQGSFCHVCGLVCINGIASKDCKTCRCTGTWGGTRCDKCKLGCTYGTPDPMCRKCNCPGGWTGPKCTMCTLRCPKGQIRDSTCTRCIPQIRQRHALALDGFGNFATLTNPVKKSDDVSTIELNFKALRLEGVQGLVCDKEQVMGSLCLRLINNHLTITVFGNHVTARDPVISGSTHMFDYNFKPFTGYSISVVYGQLRKGMAYTKLYVDGAPVSTKFFASGLRARLGTTYVCGLQGNTRGYFQGFIDELRLWSVPRMAWEIKRDFKRPMVGVEHGLVAYFPFDTPGLHVPSLGISHWQMDIDGAMYTEPFAIGRHTG